MPKFKLASIVGARPQFIKAAAISRALHEEFPDAAEEIIIHTGQHYDDNMSDVFFREMEIPLPKYNLEVGSGTHGKMTSGIISKTEELLLREKPDIVIVYGDTNTTLGAALAASKLHLPVAHVEAGLRSFNKSMPEEINRVLCDHLSTLLFVPTETGVENLVREGFQKVTNPPYSPDNPKIFHCGDVMYDTALHFLDKAKRSSEILGGLGLAGKDFILCTIHRQQNTDDPERLSAILDATDSIAREFHVPVVMPVHPRTARMMASLPERGLMDKIESNPLIMHLDPVGYFDMLMLESHSRIILTDSGGVQKEAFFFRKPCIVLRAETEWKELVDSKAAILANSDPKLILQATDHFFHHPPANFPPFYGDGRAAIHICSEIVAFLR